MKFCRHGYHVCTKNSWNLWIEENLWEVETRGEEFHDNQKYCFQQIRLVKKLNWNNKIALKLGIKFTRRALIAIEKKYDKNDIDIKYSKKLLTQICKFSNNKITKKELDDYYSKCEIYKQYGFIIDESFDIVKKCYYLTQNIYYLTTIIQICTYTSKNYLDQKYIENSFVKIINEKPNTEKGVT